MTAPTWPNSAGTERPRSDTPPGACDAHMHIYDPAHPRFGSPDAFVQNATVADYRQLQARIGTRRTVVVEPRVQGTDNTATLAAIQALGMAHTRGVAVVRPDITDEALSALDAGGGRGIRFTLYTAENAATSFAMVAPLARRVHELGWHVQLHWRADQIAEHAALLNHPPCTLVFDHLARLPVNCAAHPAYRVVSQLLDRGRDWIKLSGAYLSSAAGVDQGFHDTDALASRWVSQAPERLVWRGDWPHATEPLHKPDDAELFDLLTRWVPDESTRLRVLVDNPAPLYRFGPI